MKKTLPFILTLSIVMNACVSSKKYNNDIRAAQQFIQEKERLISNLDKQAASNEAQYQSLSRQFLLTQDSLRLLQLDFKTSNNLNNELRDSLGYLKEHYQNIQYELNGNASILTLQVDSLSRKLKALNRQILSQKESIFKLQTEVENLEQYKTLTKPSCSAEQINYLDRSFAYFKVNPESFTLRMHLNDSSGVVFGDFGKLHDSLVSHKQNLVFATNGGMFHANQNPVGLYIEKGVELFPVNTNKGGKGNFFLAPNGIFGISKSNIPYVLTTEEYLTKNLNLKYATQSGPMLVVDGKINPLFKPNSQNFHIRSGVGVAHGEVVFVMSEERVRFYEIASFFQSIGCTNALYLDGAISEMYLPELEKVANGGNFGVLISVSAE